MLNRLWIKLFLAFVTLSIATLLSLYFLQQRAFQRDFLDYVNRLGLERLEQASVRLAKRFEEVGDWSFAVRQPRVFDNLVSGIPLLEERRPPPDEQPRFRPERPPPGARRAEPEPDRRPPPDDGPRGSRPDDRGQPRPPPSRKIDALVFHTRVVLLTPEGQVLIGNPAVPRDSPAVAVMSGNVVIGRLLLAPLPALQSEADLHFARSLTQDTLVAFAFVMAGSLLLAWWLARWLLAPIKALSAGAHRLAAGDFTVRIPVTRRDELGALANDFNQLAEALHRNQQGRREWGADIAHELRTPLSILRGEIQALEDGVRPVNAAALASLQSECSRLTALVDDLYQLALSDAGALEYRLAPLDLGALVQDVVEEHRGALSDAGLTLTLDPLPSDMMVRGDGQRLAQLFGNLLVNARRYTDRPGQIQVHASRENHQWRIRIEDSPPGVPTAALPKLFDRLFRVETSRNRAAGGAGLGLAICQNIAAAHGGKISARAANLGGLAIDVTLPSIISAT